MSSSQGSSSTPGSQALQSIATDMLSRVGQAQQCFKWSTDLNSEFTTWWSTTQWAIKNTAREQNAVSNIWKSTARTSKYWQDFDQAAHFRTGHPCLICQHCSSQLEHPRTKGTGTKALKNHLASSKCRKKSMSSSNEYEQTRLFQTLSAKVGRLP